MSKAVKGDEIKDVLAKQQLASIEILISMFKDAAFLKNLDRQFFVSTNKAMPKLIELHHLMEASVIKYMEIRHKQGPVSQARKKANAAITGTGRGNRPHLGGAGA